MKIVYRAQDITEAHIIAGLLESNDINTHVAGYYLQGGIGDLAALDFVNVQVNDEDFDSAKLVISKYESNAVINDAIDELSAKKSDASPDIVEPEGSLLNKLLFIILTALLVMIVSSLYG